MNYTVRTFSKNPVYWCCYGCIFVLVSVGFGLVVHKSTDFLVEESYEFSHDVTRWILDMVHDVKQDQIRDFVNQKRKSKKSRKTKKSRRKHYIIDEDEDDTEEIDDKNNTGYRFSSRE